MDHRACVSAFTAASIQTNIKPSVDRTEAQLQAKIQKEAEDLAEETGTKEAIGAALYVGKVVRDKELRFRMIKNEGLQPAVTPTLSPNGGRIDFNWRF